MTGHGIALFHALLELVVLAIAVVAAFVWVGVGVSADWCREDRSVWASH